MVYRSYNGGVAPLTDSLTINANKAIGNYSGVYSMAFNGTYIFMGLSDYFAPDQVIIMDTLGNEIKTLSVGVCPGSFAFYTSSSAIDENNSTSAPYGFKLLANYPNPFNSHTAILFYLNNPNRVKLAIYNLKGELVNELADADFTAGFHTIAWNGDNHYGITAPTGIYFARIKVDEIVLTQKMLFLK
jgi:hypothetical protein